MPDFVDNMMPIPNYSTCQNCGHLMNTAQPHLKEALNYANGEINALEIQLVEAVTLLKMWNKSQWSDFIKENQSRLSLKTDEFLKENNR